MLPAGQSFTGGARQMLDVSPLGDRIAYVANNSLYVRDIAQHEAVRVPGTSSGSVAAHPTFSPDGQLIAFWAPGERAIKTVAIAGGTPLSLGRIELPFGMSWTGDKVLVGQGPAGILRMSGDGTGSETVVKVGRTKPRTVHSCCLMATTSCSPWDQPSEPIRGRERRSSCSRCARAVERPSYRAEAMPDTFRPGTSLT